MWTRNPLSLSSCLKSNFPSTVDSISWRIQWTIGSTRFHFDFSTDLSTLSWLASMIDPAHALVLTWVRGLIFLGVFWMPRYYRRFAACWPSSQACSESFPEARPSLTNVTMAPAADLQMSSYLYTQGEWRSKVFEPGQLSTTLSHWSALSASLGFPIMNSSQ